MEAYRLYYVSTANPKPGKGGAAAEWWKEKGSPFFEQVPGVKSIRTYATQFGLGGEYTIEFWYEIENYAVLDAWDENIIAKAQEYGQIFEEFADLFENGPNRLMGDWPESRLIEGG